jgi:hypothetical protein
MHTTPKPGPPLALGLGAFVFVATVISIFLQAPGAATAKIDPRKESSGQTAPVLLKGTVTCAKCDLGIANKCTTVIVTKIVGKETTVYFDAASHKKYHGDICNDPLQGSVTGAMTRTGDKTTIAASSVKYDK